MKVDPERRQDAESESSSADRAVEEASDPQDTEVNGVSAQAAYEEVEGAGGASESVSEEPAEEEVGAGGSTETSRYLGLTALGVVYGDIGTSPLYAFRECFHGGHGVAPTPQNVLGALSLVFWALVLVISVKYFSYVLRADNKGEGGILALTVLAISKISGEKAARPLMLVGLFGAALLFGDGAITPAISVLSAVEGLHFAEPSWKIAVVPLSVVVLAALFVFQRSGTRVVGNTFGPLMLVWFATLAALGIHQLVLRPDALLALWPGHGVVFLTSNGLEGLLVLGAVFLVVTGGEALYADIGHLGKSSVRTMWYAVVLPSLVVNYFGQGALLLRSPRAAQSPLYEMAPSWALYPLVIVATLATIIASQAVISGLYSLTRQSVMLGFWPRVHIEHTSREEIGQVYVPSTNWILMFATILIVVEFGSSASLAAAYGVAVSSTMLITTVLAGVVARTIWRWPLWAAIAVTAVFSVLDAGFLLANGAKILEGGWLPLAIAGVAFLLMTTWRRGRFVVGQQVRETRTSIDDFVARVESEQPVRIDMSAVFMSHGTDSVPAALLRFYEQSQVTHRRVILLSLVSEHVPHVADAERTSVRELGSGFVQVVGRHGFMDAIDVPRLVRESGVEPSAPERLTYFFTRDSLVPVDEVKMPRWRGALFAFMARNAQRPPAFYSIPPERVLEVGNPVEV